MQINGKNCTKLWLLPILFIYNIMEGFAKLILSLYLPFYKHI